MTSRWLKEVLDEATSLLSEAGVWSPREDAETLASHVLGVSIDKLSLDSIVNQGMTETMRGLVAQRAERIPLGYITGSVTFDSIEVRVGRGVLVPRFHSEWVLRWGLSAIHGMTAPVVADLCTGSGALALAIAHRHPGAKVYAVDISETAVECAKRNAKERSSLGDTPIEVSVGDVTDPQLLEQLNGEVDLVVANPPYERFGADLAPEWAKYQPTQAVYAGPDGTEVIRAVIDCATRLLRPGGGVAIEHGTEQSTLVPSLLLATGAYVQVEHHHGYDHRRALDPPLHTTARKK